MSRPQEFLTTAETAAILKVSIPTVKRLIASGALPSIKAGKLRRIRRSDLDAWEGTESEPVNGAA